MIVASLYRSLLLTLAICSAIVFIISGQTWVSVTITEADVPTLDYYFSGRELEPIIGALAIVPAVGVVGLIAAKGFIQRLIGFIIGVVGLALAYLTFSISDKWTTYVENLVANKLGRNGISFEMTTSSLGGALVLPSLGIALVGFWFTLKSFDSAKKKANYDTPQVGVGTLTPWQAMDSGIDPTISISDSGFGQSGGNGSGPGSS